MKNHSPLFFLILALAVVSLACQFTAPAPTSTPEPEQPALSQPTETRLPRPTRTAKATAQATAKATPDVTTQPGEATRPPATSLPEGSQLFRDDELGVSVLYPDGWEAVAPQSDQQAQGIVQFFASPDQKLIAILFAYQVDPGYTLESYAAEVRDSNLQALQNSQLISDGTVTLADGRTGWTTILEGKSSSGTLKMNATSTLRGSWVFTILVYGSTTNFDKQAAVAELFATSLHTEADQVYGVPRDQALVVSGGESTNPRNYDPATTHSGGDKFVFSGLVSFDTQLQLVPELAESWEVADGVVYTFHLRPNAVFHDGRPVTAQDFIYSWERAADPKTESDTVLTYLGDIVGVKEMHAGLADHIAGIEALDDHTLQVTIDAPKPYFLQKLTYPTAFVVDRQNVESGPEWYRTPNGTGPYKLTRWDSFKVRIYQRNEQYYLGAPAIPYIIMQIYAGVPIRLYEAGEIDVAGVSYYDVPRVTDPDEPLHAELLSGVDLCTSYVTFDVTQPPFDDLKVRQAFTMAFDRQKYIDVVLRGIGIPAQGLFPPGLPGYNIELKGLPYDPEAARRLLAESKYGGPEGLPPIVYTSGGLGSDPGSSISALAQMWQQTLGVTITVENLEPNFYLDKVYGGEHGQIFDAGWCADYPDPENFADVLFHTGAEQNNGHYSNAEVDALLDQARIEPDVAKRIQLYQQAEQLIVNDAPVIFTVHSLSYILVKPYIQGYVLLPIDIPLERYLWIDASKVK